MGISKKKIKGFDIINICVLTGLMVLMLYPVFYVLLASVSNSNELLKYRGLLWKPLGFSTAAYSSVLQNPNIVTGYIVTLFVVVTGTFLDVFMTSLAAFVLSRKNFTFNKVLFPLILFTMYFSGGMIPRYLFINDVLHLGNSVWSLILPGLISTWNLLIMKTNFETIPESLEESVRIDGGNEIVILFRIILPLSKPIIAVMVLMYAVGHWNAWFDAMLFLRSRELYPLQIILREILISNSVDSMIAAGGSGNVEALGESIKYATIVISTLPILCIYPFLQKYFAKGAMMGAVKG